MAIACPTQKVDDAARTSATSRRPTTSVTVNSPASTFMPPQASSSGSRAPAARRLASSHGSMAGAA